MYDKIGLAVSGLSLILNIVGVAIPYWFYYSGSIEGAHVTIKFGLWTACKDEPEGGSQGDVVSVCTSFDDLEDFPLPSEFKAARALEILAMLATVAAAIVVCLKMFVRKDDNRLLYAASPIPFIAGLLMIIGAIVFVADNKLKELMDSASKASRVDINLKPHAAFGLCIVSGILSFVAGPLYFLAARTIPGLR